MTSPETSATYIPYRHTPDPSLGLTTGLLGILGLFFAYNFRLQVKQKTADGRMRSYSELWVITGPARPTWLKELPAEELRGPVTEEEREKLYVALTKWYYENGNGIFLVLYPPAAHR